MKALLTSILLICAAIAIAEDYYYERGTGRKVPQNSSSGWRRWPYRAFGTQVVNLSALIDWWNKADKSSRDDWALYGSNYLTRLPARPLTAWYRVYGDIISEDQFGWIVQGCVQNAPAFSRPATFQLRHPPRDEKARFDELNAALARLKSQAGLEGLPRHQVVLSVEQFGNGTFVTNYSDPANPNLYVQALPIWEELDKIPITGTNYHVDLFAAKIGYLQDGSHREVFDLGQIRYPTH